MAAYERITGKGMDRMSTWQQHYYTWSTKSLSQNRVGLGIVAASKNDRDSIRIAENYGAKSEVLREEDVTIERGSFCPEIPGYVRTGATPCVQGADQRNNKFVHIYSTQMEELLYPEQYLTKMDYQVAWDGGSDLKPVLKKEQKTGRDGALQIIKEYELQGRLEELFYDVYHCMLAGEKPLSIVDGKREEKEFEEYSRKMMILIHYMIPPVLRKEADYVSYVKEDSQEAHFLFRKEGGLYRFDQNKNRAEKNYALLEKDFYKILADAFVRQGSDFESMMDSLQNLLCGLSDKRNQLDKCVFSFMASMAGKEKKKEEFFTSLERLMYWARKDKILIPAITEATKDLDFHGMNEEELLSYTKLMLTGAGGETKEMAYEELNRMICYYYEKKDSRFDLLLAFIKDNNSKVYEKILIKNDTEHGFTKEILYRPIEDKEELEAAIRHYSVFLFEEKYRTFVVESAYALYQQAGTEKKREEIAALGKKADEKLFVRLKQNDVEKVVKAAGNLEEYQKIVSQMAVEDFEQPIKELLCKYYQTHLERKLNQMDISEVFKEYPGNQNQQEQPIFAEIKIELLGKHYRMYMENTKNAAKLNTKDWIRFVLRLSRAMEEIDKKKAKDLIQVTKKAILDSGDIYLLARANKVLYDHGVAGIKCPKSMWDMVPMETEGNFKIFYDTVLDLSFVKCSQSSKYKFVQELYELAEECENGDKAVFAWREYEDLEKTAEEYEMGESGLKKLLLFAADDVMSKSIWAVLFGMYGFFFISLREMAKFMPGYILSIGALVLLLIAYIASSLLGEKRYTSPSGIIYTLGVGILLMNLALSFDSVMGVVILFAISIVVAAGLKIASHSILDRKED